MHLPKKADQFSFMTTRRCAFPLSRVFYAVEIYCLRGLSGFFAHQGVSLEMEFLACRRDWRIGQQKFGSAVDLGAA
jgi:hypothetical protein